jgi:hypothetical protein
MADKTPIVLNGEFHSALSGGDTLPGSAIKLAGDAGNAVTVGGDGGLLVAAAAIAAAFKTCAGLAHNAGASVPTCQEMNDAITTAVGSIPEDQFLQVVNYDPVTHTMTFVMSEGGEEYTVDLSDLVPIVVDTTTSLSGDGTVATPLKLTTPEAAAPAVTQGTDLPTNIVGGRQQVLGQPNGWMTLNGKKLPYWN